MKITFVRYVGSTYPKGHKFQYRAILTGIKLYAVPGGGVADKASIREWAAIGDHEIVFAE